MVATCRRSTHRWTNPSATPLKIDVCGDKYKLRQPTCVPTALQCRNGTPHGGLGVALHYRRMELGKVAVDQLSDQAHDSPWV